MFSKNTQNCFAYNSVTKYRSEAVLYSKHNYITFKLKHKNGANSNRVLFIPLVLLSDHYSKSASLSICSDCLFVQTHLPMVELPDQSQ